MANTYPILTSNALSALLAAIKQDGVNISPQDSEAANVLGAVDRQTRWFMYSFLSQCFDDNGILKPGTVNGQGETFNQQISGSSSNAITGTNGGAIIQGTVSTPDIRSQAVGSAQIANGAVGPAQLQAGLLAGFVSLTLTNWITATMLTAQSVGTTAIVDAAITAQKIALGAISAAQVAAGSLTYDRLANALGSGYLLISGLTPFTFAAQPMTGDATIDNTGKLTITKTLTQPFVILEEQTAFGVNAGNSINTGTVTRGAVANGNGVWTTMSDINSLMVATPTNDGKIKVAAGTYLCEGRVPGYQCGIHKAFITSFTSLNVSVAALYGTGMISNSGADASVNASEFRNTLVIPSGGYFSITQYTQSAFTGGMGLAISLSGQAEIYSTLKLTKIA